MSTEYEKALEQIEYHRLAVLHHRAQLAHWRAVADDLLAAQLNSEPAPEIEMEFHEAQHVDPELTGGV
jgi:hypothetical protein